MTFLSTTIRKDKNGISINIKNFVPALLRKPCVQVKFFFSARCADATESNGIETIGIASVVCELLISATFRAELDHCAVPLYGGLPSWQAVQRCKHAHVRMHTQIQVAWSTWQRKLCAKRPLLIKEYKNVRLTQPVRVRLRSLTQTVLVVSHTYS